MDVAGAGSPGGQIIHFPLSAASDPEKSMAQREIQKVVEHAIDELPEAFRIVFITRVIEGMNVEETAEILGLKPETVKTRLHRARNILRDNVEKKVGPVVMEAFPFAGKRCERLTEVVLEQLGYSRDFREPFRPRSIQPCATNNAGRPCPPAPQEYQTMFIRLSAAIAAVSFRAAPPLRKAPSRPIHRSPISPILRA